MNFRCCRNIPAIIIPEIVQVDNFRFLGVDLDQFLFWGIHIDFVCKKLNSTLNSVLE